MPGSSSCATRSRGNSLPRPVCLARAVSPAAECRFVSFGPQVLHQACIASALARNSAERVLICDFNACMFSFLVLEFS